MHVLALPRVHISRIARLDDGPVAKREYHSLHGERALERIRGCERHREVFEDAPAVPFKEVLSRLLVVLAPRPVLELCHNIRGAVLAKLQLIYI